MGLIEKPKNLIIIQRNILRSVSSFVKKIIILVVGAVSALLLAPFLTSGQNPPQSGQQTSASYKEPVHMLSFIADRQVEYFNRNLAWAGYPSNDKVFESLGLTPFPPVSYAYYCGNDSALPQNPRFPYQYPTPLNNWQFGVYPEITLSDFVCMAVGNNDKDSFPDVWLVDKFKIPIQVLDDSTNKVLVDICQPMNVERYFEALLAEQPPQNPTRVFVEINVAAYRADLYEDGRYLKSYPIAIGTMGYKTPIQDFFIERIEWNPWWYPPDAPWTIHIDESGNKIKQKPKPPGPNNPLGPVKIVLQNAVLLHGTNKPKSIGHKASHACMRMFPDDASDLAWRIMVLAGSRQPIMPMHFYRDKSRRTYTITLMTDVQVTTVYRRLEVLNGLFLVHSDPYVRSRLTIQDVETRMSELGLPVQEFSKSIAPKAFQKMAKTISIPIQ